MHYLVSKGQIIINDDDYHDDVDDDDNVHLHESERESFSLGAIGRRMVC